MDPEELKSTLRADNVLGFHHALSLLCSEVIEETKQNTEPQALVTRELAERVTQHMAKNFELIIERESRTKF